MPKYLFVVDPGHGGSDPGAVSFGYQEKHLNLAYAQELKNIILSKFKDVAVILTRESDIDLSLEDRVKISNNLKPTLFISIHFNAGGGTGFESYIRANPTDEEVRVQNILHDQIMKINKNYDIRDRGKKRYDYYVLKYNNYPAILFEVLFIDSTIDRTYYIDAKYRYAWCNELAYALKKAYNLEYIEYEKPPQEYIKPAPEEIPSIPPAGQLPSDLPSIFSNIISKLQEIIDYIKQFISR